MTMERQKYRDTIRIQGYRDARIQGCKDTGMHMINEIGGSIMYIVHSKEDTKIRGYIYEWLVTTEI